MNKNLFFSVFVIMFGLFFIAVSDLAESLDITQVIQGSVKEIKGSSIKITEDSGKEDQIAIDSNTVYDNVQKLTDLKAGDNVQIDYKTEHKEYIAVTVTKIELANNDNL